MEADESNVSQVEVFSSLVEGAKRFVFSVWKAVDELFAGLPGFDNGRARVSSTSDGVILFWRDRRGLEGAGDGMDRSESEGDGWRNRARFDDDGPFLLRCSGAIVMFDSRNRARGVS